jgi:hypothetical protein
MVVNDDTGLLIKRGVLKSIASKLAPTGDQVVHWLLPGNSCTLLR